MRSFKAHDAGSINHMKQINGTSLLVTVAEDLSNEPVLKVWALDTEKKDGGPRCLSTVSVQNARRQFPVRETPIEPYLPRKIEDVRVYFSPTNMK